MYQAMNASRYHRQEIIREIEAISQRRLICYVSGAGAYIDRDDSVFLVDLLHNIPENSDLDLLLHTPGGDIDAAEKFITLVQSRVGTGTLRAIVPDYAKSAGTLMVLGTSKVVMSDTSELGPINPQVISPDASGVRTAHPVQSYLDAYYDLTSRLSANPSDAVAQTMLKKLDPSIVKEYEAVNTRARRFAEEELLHWMLRADPSGYTAIAANLMDTQRWATHGQMIGWQSAESVGLAVEYLRDSDPFWAACWSLYCHLRLAIKDNQKIFESNYGSIITDVMT